MEFSSDKEEIEHLKELLKNTSSSLRESNSYNLNELSNQTIHSASITQHTEFITLAVLIYSLSKLITRKSKFPEKKWDNFVKRFCNELNNASSELQENNMEEFSRHIDHAKELLTTLSPNQRQDVEEVMKKSSINKAGKIFEHGISLNRTAHLLGITPWELASYIGQGKSMENQYIKTIPIKQRIKFAQDFFS
ncbi:MAG: hypothetical protein AABW79_01205 [Nanoarchaeota archaeon]